jgi:hypothetical protein
VKGQFCPCLIPFISSLHHWRVGPRVGVIFNLGLAPETAAHGSIGSRQDLPCLAAGAAPGQRREQRSARRLWLRPGWISTPPAMLLGPWQRRPPLRRLG